MIGITRCQVVECLSFHATYRCRHSGVCCQAGWNVPFTAEERARVEPLQLVRSAFGCADRSGVSLAARRSDGACAFLEDTHRCAIHRVAGQDALPESCRMFPRLVLHDALGSRLSLSHYCPTAAAMLFEGSGPVTIVNAPASLTDVGPLDGLDARHEWPPLLREGVLTDLESYRLWEVRGIELLTAPERTAVAALRTLEEATEIVGRWSPGGEALGDTIERAFMEVTERSVNSVHSDAALKRWLAARLFGNWIAYQGRGLETIVRYLRACLDMFTVEVARDGNALEAIRRSDYLIVHEADSHEISDLLENRATEVARYGLGLGPRTRPSDL